MMGWERDSIAELEIDRFLVRVGIGLFCVFLLCAIAGASVVWG